MYNYKNHLFTPNNNNDYLNEDIKPKVVLDKLPGSDKDYNEEEYINAHETDLNQSKSHIRSSLLQKRK